MLTDAITMTSHDMKNGRKNGWNVVIDRMDGRDYLTRPQMPDGEREWGDLAERAIFRNHDMAKEMASIYGGMVAPE